MPASTALDRIRPGPGRPCTICEHPQRDEIDNDLRCGRRYRTIAARYQLASHHNVIRHAQAHLEAVPGPPATQDATDPERLKARLLELEERLGEWLDAFEAATSPRLALDAADQIRKVLELLAKIGGQLDDRVVVVTAAHEDRLGAILRVLVDEVIARREEPAEVLLAERRSLVARAVEATG